MPKILIRDREVEIEEDDLWLHPQSGQQILSHTAVQKLAEEFSLKALKPELLISPSEENGGLLVLAVGVTEGEEVTWEIGEASDVNTTSVSRQYKACIAWKRGFDRAVLLALGMYNVSSDIEAEDFAEREEPRKAKNKPSPKTAPKGKKEGNNSKGEVKLAPPNMITMIKKMASARKVNFNDIDWEHLTIDEGNELLTFLRG